MSYELNVHIRMDGDGNIDIGTDQSMLDLPELLWVLETARLVVMDPEMHGLIELDKQQKAQVETLVRNRIKDYVDES